MKNHLETLSKEYKDINSRMNKILQEHNLNSEDLGNLPYKALREFSELNKQLFEINNEMIEAFKKIVESEQPRLPEPIIISSERLGSSDGNQVASQAG